MRKFVVLLLVFAALSVFGAVETMAQEVVKDATGFQMLKEKFNN